MAKIYKTTDKISYKIGDIKIKVSPLSLDHKIQLLEVLKKGQSGELTDVLLGSIMAIQFSLKEIDGLENNDGSKYELQFENGMLTKECAEELLNIEQTNQLIQLCSSFVSGVPSSLPLGVELIPNEQAPKNT